MPLTAAIGYEFLGVGDNATAAGPMTVKYRIVTPPV